jgi:TPR repeat protein
MNKSFTAHYFKTSEDQGNSQAQFNYGVIPNKGEGIAMNTSLAAHY